MSKVLNVIATMAAKAGAEDALRTLLLPAIAKFRGEAGCEGYTLLEDRKKPGRFMTFETWTDEAALAAHMTSPTVQALGPAMKALLDREITQDFLTALVKV